MLFDTHMHCHFRLALDTAKSDKHIALALSLKEFDVSSYVT